MKKLLKAQKGITLVALVITIVILIILATITINFAFGEDGLIQKAQEAKKLTEEAVENEQKALNSLMDEYDKIINEEFAADTLVEAFKAGEIKAGDYVNYTPDNNAQVNLTKADTGYEETQTYTTDTTTTWRVLGLTKDVDGDGADDGEEHLILISGSPIKKNGEDPYLVLKGARGYLSCVETLNKASSVYNNSELAEKTRSITIKDIENVLGGVTVTYPEEGGTSTGHGSGGTVTFNKASSPTNVGTTTPYSSYTYAEEAYTPEGALQNPPIQAGTEGKAGTKVIADAYNFVYNYEGYQSIGLDIDRDTYDMLFKDTTEDTNYSKSYWLASPGVVSLGSSAIFGPGSVFDGAAASGSGYLFDSDGYWSACGVAVRPVVVLKSNITIDQVKVIPDEAEEPWTTEGGNTYGSGTIDDM